MRCAGALGLILAGGLASVVRWVAMGFDPPLAVLACLQALHGLTYGATHLGAVHFMSRHVPPAQAGTAQALYASVTAGIAMGLATLLAGRLYPTAGASAYLAMSLFAAGRGAGAADRALRASRALIADSPRVRAAAAA